MEQMLWPSVHQAVPRTCYLRPELPWEPAAPLVREFTQVDGDALRWLRTEQMPRMPARPLEASLPTSLKMPKLGFWRDRGTEANVPTGRECLCAFRLNESRMAVHGRPCMGKCWFFLSLTKKAHGNYPDLWLLLVPPRVKGSTDSVLFSLIPPTCGFWEKCLAKGGGAYCFVGLGTL